MRFKIKTVVVSEPVYGGWQQQGVVGLAAAAPPYQNKLKFDLYFRSDLALDKWEKLGQFDSAHTAKVFAQTYAQIGAEEEFTL